MSEQFEFHCEKCGQVHEGLPTLAFNTPDFYEYLNEKDRDELVEELSSDFCVIRYPEQTDRFIRAVMTIPILDACEDLDYGIWVSLSEKSFADYRNTYQKDVEERQYFGRICNAIPGYEDTLNLHVEVRTRNDGFRPEVVPYASDHPLVTDWENGITYEEAKSRVDRAFQ